jgi:hypothetical protein
MNVRHEIFTQAVPTKYVADGQYQRILDQELTLIRNTCKQAYPATMIKPGSPNRAIIVRGKCHHTRFYPTQKKNPTALPIAGLELLSTVEL